MDPAAQLAEAAALHAQGRPQEAEALARAVLRAQPGHPGALHRLGLLARDLGNPQKGLELLLRAARIRPEDVPLLNDLGALLGALRLFGPAIHRLEAALALEPDRPETHLHLARIYSDIGLSAKAIAAARRALELDPDHHAALVPIASSLMSQGNITEALELWRQLLSAIPGHGTHSPYLFSMHYPLACSPAEIAAEHFRFAELYETPLRPLQPAHSPLPIAGRPLRVGYVSPDYRLHPVRIFLLPVLQRHNPAEVEFYCYSNVPDRDAGTTEFAELAGARWRDIYPLDDDAAAALIRADQIDILVDLAGHSGGSRLLLFARKPAPVQVTWLGYPDTTGLTSIDYRITDAVADPPGLTEAFHSETLFRLPCFLTYAKPSYIPPVAPPPCLRNGFVTFGSFNNFMKIDPAVIRLWASILEGVPGSKLLLKHRDARDPGALEHFASYFAQHGIDSERLIFAPQMPSHGVHLEHYADMDIALDPFPYNGTTTSCEALAMGVPLVVLAGAAHVARVGVDLNLQYGLDDWVAATPDEYRRIAIANAADPAALAELRSQMRARLAASALGNPDAFVHQLESAYREMMIARVPA